ncbi:MAG TPA: hypothetical protein VHA80_10260 [Solirubrobacterales bacterium]|nr:hypothetical protein [Solirubrobacterales bacterium]
MPLRGGPSRVEAARGRAVDGEQGAVGCGVEAEAKGVRPHLAAADQVADQALGDPARIVDRDDPVHPQPHRRARTAGLIALSDHRAGDPSRRADQRRPG